MTSPRLIPAASAGPPGVTRLTSNVEGVPLLGTNNDVYMRDGLPGYNANFFSVSAVLKF